MYIIAQFPFLYFYFNTINFVYVIIIPQAKVCLIYFCTSYATAAKIILTDFNLLKYFTKLHKSKFNNE